MRFVYMILLSMMIVGCGSKSIDKLWQTHQQEADYRLKLLKTQQAILYISDDSKVSLVATYLGSIDNKERFVISVYIDTQDDVDLFDICKIELSSQSPIISKKLDKSDRLLDDIPFKADWKDYYVVEFSSVDSDKMYLTFKTNTSSAKLYFAKKAKYLLR